MPLVVLQCMIVVFRDHSHLLLNIEFCPLLFWSEVAQLSTSYQVFAASSLAESIFVSLSWRLKLYLLFSTGARPGIVLQ